MVFDLEGSVGWLEICYKRGSTFLMIELLVMKLPDVEYLIWKMLNGKILFLLVIDICLSKLSCSILVQSNIRMKTINRMIKYYILLYIKH